jgi:hypothetical protein
MGIMAASKLKKNVMTERGNEKYYSKMILQNGYNTTIFYYRTFVNSEKSDLD